ncbi:MAG TPA: ABC transporter permease [Spirochaetota bacterium]|nr:ABC transporter permease [Spirochaetota bacterium]HRZ25570.1 ABC transporter permease [Spirochaetota bacterium]HSA15666.1 ABC transporter permease [Spirochaetota bacterium]
MPPLIELSGISRVYAMGSVSVQAVDNLTLSIEAGEFVAIMGHSGSGKSTLLNILGFLDRPDSGSYRLMGKETSTFSDDELSRLRNRVAGFVFQQFHLLPRMSVLENTELPLLYSGFTSEGKRRAAQKIDEVGLGHRMKHNPSELSGGEQQRVAIARSMINDPYILFADEPTGNLDTKNEHEILSLLKSLNAAGTTIIMVTHESDIAEQADRIITMRDGKIISDRRTNKKKKTTDPISSNISLSDPGANISEILSYLRQAIASLLSHKMRSFLSILGILIGVTSVITMMAIGRGAQESIETQLNSLGSNVLSVRPGSMRTHGVALESGTVTRLTLEDAEEMGAIPEISGVSAIVSDRAQVVYGNRNWNTSVSGVTPEYAEIRSLKPIAGSFFTDRDVGMRKKTAVLGVTVTRELFANANPVGKTIKINRVNFTVAAVLPELGSMGPFDRDDTVLIPVTTGMYRLMGKTYIDSIDVQVRSRELIDQAKKSIKAMIVRRHRLDPDDEDSFSIRDMTEMREAVAKTSQTIGMLLGIVSVISLIVGGIGIMNIMLVTVKERTREIGLRKAVGARKKDILLQFLIESVLLTSTGGMLGIAAGGMLSLVLGTLAQWPVSVTFVSIIMSTVFSVMVGIFFGLWPAIQASRLKPVEALRYE